MIRVSLGKVLALEQQQFADGLAQCVAEAVAEIERRRMPSLAEVADGMPGCRQLLGRDGLDRNPGRGNPRDWWPGDLAQKCARSGASIGLNGADFGGGDRGRCGLKSQGTRAWARAEPAGGDGGLIITGRNASLLSHICAIDATLCSEKWRMA